MKGCLFVVKEGFVVVFEDEGYICGEIYEVDELCIYKFD